MLNNTIWADGIWVDIWGPIWFSKKSNYVGMIANTGRMMNR